jgi:hypothetical protein
VISVVIGATVVVMVTTIPINNQVAAVTAFRLWRCYPKHSYVVITDCRKLECTNVAWPLVA